MVSCGTAAKIFERISKLMPSYLSANSSWAARSSPGPYAAGKNSRTWPFGASIRDAWPVVIFDSCQFGMTARLCCWTILAYPAGFKVHSLWRLQNDYNDLFSVINQHKSIKTITNRGIFAILITKRPKRFKSRLWADKRLRGY